jgi:hypothetical protein
MQAHSWNIDPALQGTRYGEALLNAAQAEALHKQREAEALAAWQAAHPATEAVDTWNAHEIALIVGWRAKRAAQWASLLSCIDDGEWHCIPGTKLSARNRLLGQDRIEPHGETKGRQYRITALGKEWLASYRQFHPHT